jgi:CRP-like cAMP-binding protein
VTVVTAVIREQVYKNTNMNTSPVQSGIANELYAMLSPELCAELKHHERSMTVPEGTALIRHGVLPDRLVIVHSGKVKITFSCSSESVCLDCTEVGKVFGMRAAISGELPEIDVVAVEPCRITVLPRDAFLGLLKANPEIYFAVAKVLSTDLQIADRILRNSSRRCSSASRVKSPRPV